MRWALLLLLALPANANAVRFGGQTAERSVTLPSGPPSLAIAALPYARTVTCTGAITLTGTAPGAGAVSWAASPDGASGSCTGTTSWSCAVAVSPNAAGEGVETITITQAGVGGSSRSVDVGFYVAGAHSCFLAQSINGTYNSGLNNADAVATWVNLGSSALNVTQATGSAQPSLRTSVVNGQPVVRCDGTDRVSASTAADWTFLNDGSDTTTETAFSVASADPDLLQAAIMSAALFSGGSRGYMVAHDDRVSQSRNERGLMSISNGTAIAVNLVSANLALPATKMNIAVAILDDDGGAGVDATLIDNSVAVSIASTAAYSASAPVGGLTICASTNGTFPLTGDVWRVLIYQSALDATQRAINLAVDEWALGSTYPVTLAGTFESRWLFAGDSLTEGKPGAGRWQDKVQIALADGTVEFDTAAKGGDEVFEIAANWRLNDDPPPNRLFILGGTNDLVAGKSAVDTFDDLTAIYTEAQGLGVEVIAMTIPPFGSYVGWTSTIQTEIDALNALVMSSPDVDIAIDIYTAMEDPITADVMRVAWRMADGVHPDDDGTTGFANAVIAALGI